MQLDRQNILPRMLLVRILLFVLSFFVHLANLIDKISYQECSSANTAIRSIFFCSFSKLDRQNILPRMLPSANTAIRSIFFCSFSKLDRQNILPRMLLVRILLFVLSFFVHLANHQIKNIVIVIPVFVTLQ